MSYLGWQILAGKKDWETGEWGWSLGVDLHEVLVGFAWNRGKSPGIYDVGKTRQSFFTVTVYPLPFLVFSFHWIKYHPR
jgi:hypothetical protein